MEEPIPRIALCTIARTLLHSQQCWSGTLSLGLYE